MNAKDFKGSTLYRVTAHVKGNPDFTVVLRAPREGLAKTRTMVLYPYPLAGAMVTYTVDAAVRFTFDDAREFEGFATGTTWNGFDNVKITLETARAIDAHFAPEIVGYNENKLATFPLDADGLIDLSGGYATSIVDEDEE